MTVQSVRLGRMAIGHSLRNCLSVFKQRLHTPAEKTQNILQKMFGDTDENGQKDGRLSDGNIPNANWNDKFYLDNGYHRGNANPNLRTRVEVSRNQRSITLLFACYMDERWQSGKSHRVIEQWFEKWA